MSVGGTALGFGGVGSSAEYYRIWTYKPRFYSLGIGGVGLLREGLSL